MASWRSPKATIPFWSFKYLSEKFGSNQELKLHLLSTLIELADRHDSELKVALASPRHALTTEEPLTNKVTPVGQPLKAVVLKKLDNLRHIQLVTTRSYPRKLQLECRGNAAHNCSTTKVEFCFSPIFV